jgi:3-oxoacyl-[acyl-carrier protein] reductase
MRDARTFAGKAGWIIGASGALGQSAAKVLAAAGAELALSSRHPQAIAAEIGPEALAVPLDITSTASVNAAAALVIGRFGRIDFLVVSTTLPLFGDILELDDDAWRDVFETKQLGAVRAIRAVLPDMLKRGNGSIVLLSGRGGRHPNPVHLPGGTANAALDLLALGLARAYTPRGIRINTVAPGPIASPRWEALRAASAGQVSDTGPGRPEDVAQTIAFLLSPAAAHISGTTITVDGAAPPAAEPVRRGQP